MYVRGPYNKGKVDDDNMPAWMDRMPPHERRAYYNYNQLITLNSHKKISEIARIINVPHGVVDKILATIADPDKRKHKPERRAQVDLWIASNPGLYWLYTL
ncbi:hypothetical protein NVP1031O_194 [Vibrio phage 1.031.O._10N.261.46.F8]|nr:hypothetical protein NVP1031O_194 [Vibrio phage 1.031.O._10N.261.46.F8]